MAGVKSTLQVQADYLTDMKVYRQGLNIADADDPELIAAPLFEIDFSNSISAHRNRIELLPQRTSGSGTVDILVFAKITGSINGWVQVDSKTSVDSLALTVFSNLPAYWCRVLIANLTASSDWDLNVAYSGDSGHE